MNTRSLIFKNFRNLGIDSISENLSNKLLIGSIDEKHIGGLIILLGGNNEGKSNVLDGFLSCNKKRLTESDKPNFIDYDKNLQSKTQIIFDYKITDKEKIAEISLANKKEIQDIESGIFSGRTFGIFFTEGSLKKGVELNSVNTEEEYCLFIERMLSDSIIYGIYGHDESSGRLEIRLILPQHNRMLLCSVEQIGNALMCFSAVIKNCNEIKDMDRAIKLNCSFKVDSKAPKNCDNANLLINYLRQDFEKRPYSSNVLNEELHLRAALEFNDTSSYKIYAYKIYTDSMESKEKSQQPLDLRHDIDVMQRCFNIPLHPNIVFYMEQGLSDSDLKFTGNNINDDTKSAKFFRTLFKILNINIESIHNARKGNGNSRDSLGQYITNKCKEIIDERFNVLYCLSNDVYSFSVRIEESNIEFGMKKNGSNIYLSQQSIGFKKFFNLFFNFLYDDKIKKGDIVLMDEAETHLSIPAQKELQNFLRDYGQKSGITFIISTHSPFMVSVKHLDEVRIVKALNSLESINDNAKGSLIINDFSIAGYGKSDTLNDLRVALGESISLDVARLVFVEGIMDYNILTAYSKIYDFKDSKELIFLPISGLGAGKINSELESSDENSNKSTSKKELCFSKEQREKALNLIEFARKINLSNPILLVDSDSSGKAMKKGICEDSSLKDLLCCIEIEAAFIDKNGNRKANFKDLRLTDIEFLLSEDDRVRFGFESCKENKNASLVSSIFKNMNNLKSELSLQSKNNFNELFKYLIDHINSKSKMIKNDFK